jgi:hypothetical protein
MNSAFYSSSIKDLVDQTPETVLGYLAKPNPFSLDALQRNAWVSQIDLVRAQLGGLEGWIAFEFAIPRMGKRADVVSQAALNSALAMSMPPAFGKTPPLSGGSGSWDVPCPESSFQKRASSFRRERMVAGERLRYRLEPRRPAWEERANRGGSA